MCTVSDKIKFCTCSGDDINIEELDHYWVLNRYHKGKDDMVLGTPSLPTEYKDPNFQVNRDHLLARVNEPDIFDKPFDFKRKDRLELVLNNNQNYEKLYIYEFEYTGKEWKYVSHDPFELMNHYDEVDSGKLDNVY